MRWHHENASKNRIMHHPADSPAWKTIDYKWHDFSNDPRNVRLVMAAEYGFNTFGNLSSSHNVWSVVLVTYNLPPWLCMKMSFCFFHC